MNKKFVLLVALMMVFLLPLSVSAQRGQGQGQGQGQQKCRPKSDAEALVILSNYYPGYWWDHTDITIAAQIHPNAKPQQVRAIHDAIQVWSDVLDDCFEGAITLTDVSGKGNNPQQAADIVVHYVPTAGGVVFGGYAICGDHGCPNIMVRSDLPPAYGIDPYSPQYLNWVIQHEVGHALGLGHTTNLLESIDLMGYGWPGNGDPILSQCDIEGLKFVFAWVFEGSDPHPPATGPFAC